VGGRGERGGGGGGLRKIIRSVSLLEQKIGIHASFYTQGRASKLSQNSLFILIICPLLPSPAQTTKQSEFFLKYKKIFMICDVNHPRRRSCFFYEELCTCFVKNDDFILIKCAILGIST
jgi:hypothetical protein